VPRKCPPSFFEGFRVVAALWITCPEEILQRSGVPTFVLNVGFTVVSALRLRVTERITSTTGADSTLIVVSYTVFPQGKEKAAKVAGSSPVLGASQTP